MKPNNAQYLRSEGDLNNSAALIITREQLTQALTIFDIALNKISKEYNYAACH